MTSHHWRQRNIFQDVHSQTQRSRLWSTTA